MMYDTTQLCTPLHTCLHVPLQCQLTAEHAAVAEAELSAEHAASPHTSPRSESAAAPPMGTILSRSASKQ
jgi:hypothetical protein